MNCHVFLCYIVAFKCLKLRDSYINKSKYLEAFLSIIIYYRDQPWFSVFKHSMDHEEGV